MNKTTFNIEGGVLDVKCRATDLSKELVKEYIQYAKKTGAEELTFTYEPLIGPFLSLELKDYDENGEELPTN